MFKILPCRKFLGSRESYDEAKVILFSVPLDHTGSFRPGTRFAPSSIRENSYVLEEFSLLSNNDIREIPFYDWGELELPPGDILTSLALIEDVTTEVLKGNKFPAVIGGEHLISLPTVKALKQKFNDLVVFDLDAHFDLRDSYLGMRYSHATVMRRIGEIIGIQNIYQFGIRSGTKEERDFGILASQLPLSKTGFEEAISNIDDRPIYITLDMDVVDPAFAPGVGTPEPGGPASHELLEALRYINKGNLIGFDIVEVSPPYDPSAITSILGAKVIIEILDLLYKKP